MINKIKKTWTQIGYDKGYRADEHGNVISPFSGRKLKLCLDRCGYYRFAVSGNGCVHVHRLVAYQKFKEKCFDEGMVVRHLDGNSKNNSFENIGIGTQSENMMDRDAKERMCHSIKAATNRRKFTDKEMEKIRLFHSVTGSYSQTMMEFDISSKGTLHRILNTEYVTKV